MLAMTHLGTHLGTIGPYAAGYQPEIAAHLQHDLVPAAATKPPNFDQIKTVAEAKEYAKSGFHAVVKRWLEVAGTSTQAQPAFEAAAKAYYDAVGYQASGDGYFALIPLKAMIHSANVLAGKARAMVAPVAKAPPTGADADADADKHAGAGSHKVLWFLLATSAMVGVAIVVARKGKGKSRARSR